MCDVVMTDVVMCDVVMCDVGMYDALTDVVLCPFRSMNQAVMMDGHHS